MNNTHLLEVVLLQFISPSCLTLTHRSSSGRCLIPGWSYLTPTQRSSIGSFLTPVHNSFMGCLTQFFLGSCLILIGIFNLTLSLYWSIHMTRARSHLHLVGPHPSHASFTARSSCPHLHSSLLETNVTTCSCLSR
jgi:hypothetical protein